MQIFPFTVYGNQWLAGSETQTDLPSREESSVARILWGSPKIWFAAFTERSSAKDLIGLWMFVNEWGLLFLTQRRIPCWDFAPFLAAVWHAKQRIHQVFAGSQFYIWSFYCNLSSQSAGKCIELYILPVTKTETPTFKERRRDLAAKINKYKSNLGTLQ